MCVLIKCKLRSITLSHYLKYCVYVPMYAQINWELCGLHVNYVVAWGQLEAVIKN